MDLAKEYPFIHIYAQKSARQPVIIKANTEGLCVLLNAIVAAIAYPDNNGVAEAFDGDAFIFSSVNSTRKHSRRTCTITLSRK